MANPVQSVCGVIDALADFQIRVLQAINAKFLALRRLADLLEQAADLTGFIPNIGALIPISSIDLRLYEELRVACPFLHLPPATGDPELILSNLRAEVDAAYGRLIATLNLNPLNRLSKLQAKLDAFQQQFNIAALGGIDFMRCLQAACQSTLAVSTSVSRLSNLTSNDVTDIAHKYAKNVVAEGGRVLTNQQQNKAAALADAKLQIKTLRDVPSLPTLPGPPSTPAPVAV
jgi:hypothetical protein